MAETKPEDVIRVVVTGSSGLLGRAVYSLLESQPQVQVLGLANSRATPPLEQLDLLDEQALTDRLKAFSPHLIVHTAAERRPDVVEKEPDKCHELNVEVPGRIADICQQIDARMINISTDYVFDGSKPPYSVDSEPNPLNAYGTSKLLGERAVAQSGQDGKVTSLRVPVLYGPALTPSESAVNILTTAIVPPEDGRLIKMDAYAVRYPTNAQDVAKVISQLARLAVAESKPLPPILQYQATEAMTKYDMCNVLSRLQNRHAPPLAESSISHLDPEYEVDPAAATSRPRHCKMDISVLKDYGVDVSFTSFEDWWAEEMQRQADQESERLKRVEEEERIAAEKAEQQRLEAEAQAQADRERLAKEQAEAEQREHEELKRREAEESASAAAAAAAAAQSDVPNEPSTSIDQEQGSSREGTDSNDSKLKGLNSSHGSGPRATSPTPGSPNPSFSSLQARPTPPGARSPSSSQPVSLRNAEGAMTVAQDDTSAIQVQNSSETLKVHSRSGSLNGETSQSSQVNETPAPGPSRLNTIGGLRASQMGQGSQETDEDNYGQPSPRTEDASVEKPGDSSNTAQAGEAEAGPSKPKGSFGADPKAASSSKESPVFVIRVGDPHKVGDSVTGHIVYTVRSRIEAAADATAVPLGYRTLQFSSLRRYSDFRWLHAALVHNNPGIIIPPVPEKVRSLVSRFSADLVEARRHGLEICVNKIANHPTLAKDEDLRLFLESDDFTRDVKLRDAKKGPVPTPEAKTWMGWSGTVGVNSGQKFVEFDDWFHDQRAYLDSLEVQLKGMVRGINALSQSRKDLADSIAAQSHALLMLSGSSLSRSLSASFAGLGDLQRRCSELEDVQSDSDVRHFGSVLYEYERLVGSVRKAFSTRIDSWHSMVKSEEEFRKARLKHEKLKRDSPRAAGHYHEESLKELGELEDRALEKKSEFDLVGRRCKEEMKRFDRERVKDLRKAVDVWLSGQIERREELLQEWIEYAERCLGLELGEPKKKEEEEEEQIPQQSTTTPAAPEAQDDGQKETTEETTAAAVDDQKGEEVSNGPPSAEVGSQAQTNISSTEQAEATTANGESSESKGKAANEVSASTETGKEEATTPPEGQEAVNGV